MFSVINIPEKGGGEGMGGRKDDLASRRISPSRIWKPWLDATRIKEEDVGRLESLND